MEFHQGIFISHSSSSRVFCGSSAISLGLQRTFVKLSLSYIAFLISLLFAQALIECRAAEMTASPRPEWVVEYQPDLAAKPPPDLPGGLWYLLTDFQWQVDVAEKFSHYARKYVTANSIREGSRIAVDYNPAFETLAWHTLKIHRGGASIDVLPDHKFRFLSRESGLEQNLYDGRQTVVLELEGLEVGDIVEYSFSRKGSNPVFAGKFSEFIPTTWPVALHQSRIRLLYSSERKLTFKEKFPVLAAATETIEGGLIDRRWEANNVAPVEGDSDTPTWNSPYSFLQVSEYPSWQEVVSWAQQFYTIPDNTPKSLLPVISELRMQVTDQAQIADALKYVQDSIRYLSASEGAHSHEPYPIDDVVRRKYGDCKDKARLLCTILKNLGFDANVALVSTEYRGMVAELLPTPKPFDHVVVRVRRENGDVHWLDPTISHQRGPLDELYFPDYQKGLIVAKGSSLLIDIPSSGFSKSSLNVSENYELSETGEATLTRESIYRGALADEMRAYQAGESPDRMGKTLLDLFSKNSPGAVALEAPAFTDDEDLNEISIKEQYSIKNFWADSPRAEDLLTTELFASALKADLLTPTTVRRDAILKRVHPRNVTHLITVKLPSQIKIPPKARSINNASFAYDFSVSQRGQLVYILHEYRSKHDSVAPEDRDDFLKNLKEANNLLAFTLETEKPGSSPNGLFGKHTNWLFITLAICAVLISTGICVALYFWRPQWNGRRLREKYDGIGGWLFVVGIALVCRPFFQIFAFMDLSRFVDARNWTALTTPGLETYHSLWGIAIILDLVFRIWYVIFDLLLIVLFVQRRRTFPALMIFGLVSTVAFVIGTEILIHHILGAQPPSTTVSRPIASAVLWTFYLIFSKRVRHTFAN